MLKLSKISKMLLLSAMLLTFSCGVMISDAWADAKCENKCQTTFNESNKKASDEVEKQKCLNDCKEEDCKKRCRSDKKCENACTDAKTKANALINASGLGSSTVEYTSHRSTDANGVDSNGNRANNVHTYVNANEIDPQNRLGEGDLKYSTNDTLVTDANGNIVSVNYNEVESSTTETTGDWDRAAQAKQRAQQAYTDASKAYNICVAQKGVSGCTTEADARSSAQRALSQAEEKLNQEQKAASKAYYENEKAQAKADKAAAKAEAKALKADQKALNKATKEFNKYCNANGKPNDKGTKSGKSDSDCQKLMTKVDEAQQAVDKHKESLAVGADGSSEGLTGLTNAVKGADVEGADKALKSCLEKNNNDQTKCSEQKEALNNAKNLASDNLNKLRNYKEDKEQAAKKAEAECERYSAMTSQTAQAKAKAACAEAVALRKEANEAASQYASLSEKTGVTASAATGVKAAERRLKQSHDRYNDTGVFAGKREINTDKGARGADSLAGYRSGLFNYDANGDVLDTITRRAALTIVSLKPIVYIFAGFGLIAFAWMAIFNKISWKWFGNIAMGLFLVANMGRLIEYFVAGDGASQHYYIGAWNSSNNKSGGAGKLANAFKDSYAVYGDVQYNEKGIRKFVDEKDLPNTIGSTSIFEASAPGFCQGTSASGWANFTSCMGDVLATAKKAADTVKTVKATVEDVGARVQAVADAGKNIAQAAKAIAKGGSVTDILSNVGTMLNNVNNAVSTTTGVVGAVTNGMSTISNNVQDLGKSQAQQKELADRRAAGEATNKFDAMLKGQEWDETTGGVEKVDGEYASKDSFISSVNKVADNIKNNADSLNNMSQGMVQQVGAVTNVIENTSLNDLIGFGGTSTINSKRQEGKERKAQAAAAAAKEAEQAAYRESNAGKNADYRDKSSQSSSLYNDVQTQKGEVKKLQNEKAEAESAVKQNCKGDSDSSALCQAAKTTLEATSAALTSKQEQLTLTEGKYNLAKQEAETAYQAALESNIAKAEEDYKKASDEANEACAKDASSNACAKARQNAITASKQLSSYVASKENKDDKTNRYETREDVDQKLASNAEEQAMKRAEEKLKYEQEQEAARLKTEADRANQTYNNAIDAADNFYDKMNTQQKELEELKAQAEKKAKDASNACAKNPDSATCTTAQTAAKAAKEAANNKESQANLSAKQYKDAKAKADEAYKKSIEANKNQAKRDYDNAQAQAEKAQKVVNEASAKLPDAAKEAKKAQADYDEAQKAAAAAKSAYDQAVGGGDADAIAKLKAEYEAKLKTMVAAQQDAQKKASEHKRLQEQKDEAERSFNEAYSRANDAGNRLASYTNEDENRTNERRKDSKEDKDNQALVNQYQSDTNPNAVAQASKNNYIESKNKTDIARNTLQEKQAIAAQAKREYEAAREKASQTGRESDKKIAERLKKNYDLAVNEVAAAQKDYDRLNNQYGNDQKDYLRKAISSEEYKQKTYQSQMKQASADINKYEIAVSNRRRLVDEAATKYTQAKNSLDDGDNAGLQKVAQLYDKYKKAKADYDTYTGYLNKAKNDYATAQRNYQASVAEVARMENALKGM